MREWESPVCEESPEDELANALGFRVVVGI